LALDSSLYEGLARFRSALRRFLAFSEIATEAEGVTAQQYQAMLVIKTHPDGAINIGDLAEEMLLQHHGAVQLIDRLARAGLVERRRSEDDHRVVLASLTEAGTARLERLAAHHAQELLKYEPLLAESLRRLGGIGRL
jgi:DNA-binding MarR family transcriptional regulator